MKIIIAVLLFILFLIYTTTNEYKTNKIVYGLEVKEIRTKRLNLK